jgi:hypothetical protein
MNNLDYEFSPRLQQLVDMGESGLNIVHGELKNLMLIAEQELGEAQALEDESEEAMDSMQRTYWEGQLDALATVYQLTYDLSFAISDKESANDN